MSILYTESPRLFGGDELAACEYFDIGQSCDGDLWPRIVRTPLRQESNRPRAANGGRLRMPWIGGGSSDAMFKAMGALRRLMEADHLHCGRFGEQGDLFGARPHRPRPYAERHMDDRSGFFGLEILKHGIVRLRCRPLDGDEWTLGEEVEILLRPDTPYQRSYAFMPRLWRAIRRDNRKLGNFAGNHA